MDYIKFIVVSLTWSGSFILMKKAQICFGPLSIAGGRCLLGAAGLTLFVMLKKGKGNFKGQRFWSILVLVILSYVWPYAMQPVVIDKLNSGFVSIVIAFVPIFTIVASVPLLKQWPTKQELIGVIGGFVCIGILFMDKMQSITQPIYLLVALTVPLGYAFGNTWNKRAFKDTDPMTLACVSMLLGGLILTPVAALRETVDFDNEAFPVAATSMLLLGILGTGLSLGAFYELIRKRGPLFAGMVAYVIPMGGTFFGYLDGEKMTVRQVLATLGILLCVGATQIRLNRGQDTLPYETVDK